MRMRPVLPLLLSSAPCGLRHARLQGASSQEEEDVSRRIACSSLLNSLLAAAALTSVVASHSKPGLQGWVAASGAAVVFGGSSLPAKHPAAAAAGTLGFQIWVTLGNAALNLLLLSALSVSVRWNSWGAAGAAILTGTQLFAWPAIQCLGAAVGPGVWCGIGMLTSFFWGVFIFGEKLHSPQLAVTALAALICGVGGVAMSHSVDERWRRQQLSKPLPVAYTERAESATASTSSSTPVDKLMVGSDDQEAPPATKAGVGTIASGLACAIATGVFDGSLMAPFSAYRSSEAAGPNVALEYLGSFALALPVVALLPLLLLYTGQAVAMGSSRERNWRKLLSLPCALSGLGTGAMWAAGNILSVHASMRLGQAIGFPLTQVCVVISALWGILYFRELRHPLALKVFGVASCTVLVGALFLKLSGGV
ncbi:MAG: hypothetical protein SGPRY_000121 [Prymnesium sp.]